LVRILFGYPCLLGYPLPVFSMDIRGSKDIGIWISEEARISVYGYPW